MAIKTKKNWKTLCHDDQVDGYVFHFKNGEKCVLSPDDLATACGHVERTRDFFNQFKDLLEVIDIWIDGHAEKIDRVYLSFNQDGIDFTIIQRAFRIDRAFDRSVAELDVRIAKDPQFNLIRLDALSLPCCPEDSVRSFVRPSGTMSKQIA